MSALLGRMPSAVGYQPTLATEMGALQERITSTTKGSITSMQAVYVPADDLTDPAPANDVRPPRRHDGALSRDLGTRHLSGRRSPGLHIDDSRSAIVGEAALRRGTRVKRSSSAYKDLQDIIDILGMDEFPKRTS